MSDKKQTNFDLVGIFKETFGQPNPKTILPNILTENPALTQFRFNLINEEFNELKTAIENKDFVEVIDALGDILYVVYGMGHEFGIDLDKAFMIVHESNMSKLCKNEQEALDTLDYYKTLSNFANIDIKYRLSKDGVNYVVYNADTGKVLKSKYFIQPDFSCLLNSQ